MRTLIISSILIITTIFAAGSIKAAESEENCGSCDWYLRNFQTINFSLNQSLKGNKIANYKLETLPKTINQDLDCARIVCKGQDPDKKFIRIEHLHREIMRLINSGELKSPRPITDDFSKVLKK